MPNISLIPEQQKERGYARATKFKRPKRGTGISKPAVLLLIVLIAITAGLFFWNNSLTAKSETLRFELQQTIAQRDAALENRLERLNIMLGALESLVGSHRRWSRLFKMIESRVVQGVTFTTFEGSYTTGTVTVQGLTSNYNLLAQQIRSFETDEAVVKTDVSNVKINKQGLVDFTIHLIFKKDLLTGS